MKSFVTAIIVAAGNSTRMGLGYSKQFIPLLGEPVIKHTLMAFERSEIIDSVVVVCRPQDEDDIRGVIESAGISKVKALVHGGKERDESVRNGISAADSRTEYFAIHDGARPLVSGRDIENVVQAAFECGAAALGALVTDTIKTVDSENTIIGTPDRDTLRAVQTPQVFEKGLYLRALENAADKALKVTDDCKLVESIGESVKIVISLEPNIKLTTKSDIIFAQAILKERTE